MKIHSHLIDRIVEALIEVFQNGRRTDKVIEKYLKTQRKWGSRDRRFFAESVYEIVRWWRLLWFIYRDEVNPPSEFTPADVQKIWQLWYVWKNGFEALGPEFKTLLEPWKKLSGLVPIEIRESFSEETYQIGLKELGVDRWHAMLPALNKQANVYLRANTLRTSKKELVKILQEEGVAVQDTRAMAPAFGTDEDCVLLTERRNVFTLDCFKKGFFEVQDFSSQQVAHFLDLKPGLRVVDACAGAGGKSLHIAALMKNKGRIIALDVYEHKLQELKIRAKRDGVDIIETRHLESTKVVKRLHESSDRLLLDVPCSGFGVIRRNPDIKWKVNDLERIRNLQREILQNYCKIIKPGGIMVYSTCSILPSENEDQVKAFLQEHPEFTLLRQQRWDPDQGDFDGFFAASMQRK